MRFVIDANLPRHLTGWLIARGHHCEHVLDIRLAQGTDAEIWAHCVERCATIVTKDEDFASRVRAGRPGPAVVWLRTGNGTTQRLIESLTPVIETVEARLRAGDRLIEVR